MSNDMRPDIEAAWSQVSNNFGKKRDINKLPEYLNEGETVLAITGGIVARKNGLLVATNRRALFVAEGVVNQADRSSARDAGGLIAVLARAARMTSAIPASTATCCPRGTSSSTPRTITMIPTGQAATAITAGNHCAITSSPRERGRRGRGDRHHPLRATGQLGPNSFPLGRRAAAEHRGVLPRHHRHALRPSGLRLGRGEPAQDRFQPVVLNLVEHEERAVLGRPRRRQDPLGRVIGPAQSGRQLFQRGDSQVVQLGLPEQAAPPPEMMVGLLLRAAHRQGRRSGRVRPTQVGSVWR